MNAPIRIPGDNQVPGDPGSPPTIPPYIERTFADIVAAPNNAFPFFDNTRLAFLVRRLRRAALRPLNFDHTPGDLNGDGDPFDGTPLFSGSNPTPILNQTIDPTNTSDILRLATWLVNGPWDIDNDGDGLPDSVWVDLNLPAIAAPDGQLIKPMIAALIEDMDGRININYSGSYNQLATQRFQQGPAAITNDADFFNAHRALSTFGRGGGLGPAEIDFSHLFSNERPVLSGSGFIGPVSTNQTGAVVPLDAVLRTRYGNLLNVRYGGEVYNYASPYPYSSITSFAANALKFPGIGTRFNPRTDGELLSRIPIAGRTVIPHAANSYRGRPVDMAGVSQTRRDELDPTLPTSMPADIWSRQERGNTERFDESSNVAAVLDELVNQPYEFGVTEARGDDTPFSPAEQVDLLKGGPLDTRLSQLLRDAADRNEALSRLLTVESRSVDSPEIPGVAGAVQLFIQKLPQASDERDRQLLAIQLHRMLGVELRKGSKLNLNRPLGNGSDDDSDMVVDETQETATRLVGGNVANDRSALEGNAFPQLGTAYPTATSVAPSYGPTSIGPVVSTTLIPNVTERVPDFDGFDTDGDGLLDAGTLFNVGGGTTEFQKIADGDELLARHLYCLMFALIEDRVGAELVPNFPYPDGVETLGDAERNSYVAKRIAQWAANAVDYRDPNAKRTRLRYDPNPFDGFDLNVAARHTVWGMERPELEISEAIAFHDKRTRRNMTPELGTDAGQSASDQAASPDFDMDQHRIPQATAILELHSLRSALVGTGENQPHLPSDLYAGTELDLGRVVGTGVRESPVWRIAVSEPTGNNFERSTRWLFDADRYQDLVTAGRTEELNYLNVGSDLGDAGVLATEFGDWVNTERHSAEISPVFSYPISTNREEVSLADDDFNPSTRSPNTVGLERFAWFTRDLEPDDGDPITPPSLHVMLPARGSAMRANNVYWSRGTIDVWTDASTLTREPLPNDVRLPLGHYAILAPRGTTRFGLSGVTTVPYTPSNQRFEFEQRPTGWNFNYFNSGTATAVNPIYPSDPGGRDRHINHVVPIICQGYFPNEVDTAMSEWNTYRTTVADDEEVDIGFNVSAPLPGFGYYPAPQDKLDAAYPFVDCYSDGTDVAFPDVPFDQDPIDPALAVRPPISMNVEAPLHANTYNVPTGSPAGISGSISWDFIGTHQEVRTIFLQRLADPSQPWHAYDNPYLTEDFIPIDLTTFTGDGDASVEVVPSPNPMNPGPYYADSGRVSYAGGVSQLEPGSIYDAAGDNYFPLVKMDSRRKIPDVREDRPTTVMVPTTGNPGANRGNYARVPAVVRSPLTSSVNVIRRTDSNGTAALWPYDIGSNWTAPDSLTEATDPVDTTYLPSRTFDAIGAQFTQTFGFVNREFGFPVRSSNDPFLQRVYFGIGNPAGVVMNMPAWMDREFQSPIGLINVPADSRTRILESYGPGSVMDGHVERRVPFGHLLGFEERFSAFDPTELEIPSGARMRLPLGMTDQIDTSDPVVGDVAGFEQIFDFADVGPVWFDSQRWFDPSQIRFLRTTEISAQPAGQEVPLRMYNRVVETLQPPYNYIGKHRTPGKINVNTTPDYIRPANGFDRTLAVSGDELLDGFTGSLGRIMENPEQPESVLPVGRDGLIALNPGNTGANGNGFSAQFANPLGLATPPSPYPAHNRLFGNGSVYRSLSWGISSAYELDNEYGIPETHGADNYYAGNTDTSFGRGFKAFIESRRGHHSVRRAPPTATFNLGNPMLDYRYPTRFAGVFGPSRAASTPSVQRFMRQENLLETNASAGPSNLPIGFPRRSHDMGLLRPHPDFDERTMDVTQRNAFESTAGPTTPIHEYSVRVEANPQIAGGVSTDISDLQVPLVNKTLFDRSREDLHKNFRNLDRDPHFRFKDSARMANVTTHHSNVFLIRLTMGYFVVDAQTGAVGQEYSDETGEPIRSKATYMVDRTIPVGFLPGRDLGVDRTILYSEVDE
ncbi:MAG: hypothetical protein AAFV88_22775 [Planctomycetota bacterium]